MRIFASTWSLHAKSSVRFLTEHGPDLMSKASSSTVSANGGRSLNVHCARKFQEAWRKILSSGGTSNRPGRVSSLDPELLRQELVLLDDMLYWFHEAFCAPSFFDRISEFSSRSDTAQPEIFQLISYLSTHLIDISNSQSVSLGLHALGILEDMSSAQPQHTLTRAMVAITALLTPDANRKSQSIGIAAATVTSAAVSTFALVRKLLHVSNTETSLATARSRQDLGVLQMSCCNKFMEFLQSVCRLESCLDFFLSGSNFTQAVSIALSVEYSSVAEYLLCGRALESLSDCLQNAFSQSSDASETQEIVGNLLDSGIFEVFQSSRMPSLVDPCGNGELETINAAASKLLATMAFTLRTLLEELSAHNSSTVTRVHSSGLYTTIIAWVELAHDPFCDIVDLDMVASLFRIMPMLGVDKTKDDLEGLGSTIICNPLALDCVRQCFLETKSNSVRSTIVSIIQQFIISHKGNYEHIKSTKTLSVMCQSMEIVPTDIALGTLKIVENCVIIHGNLPMHELSEIVQVLRASSRVELATAVCTLCSKFIEVDPAYKKHLHTVGMINVIITMLKHYIAIVNPARLRQRMSMSSYSDHESRPDNQGIIGNLAARNAIFGCLVSLLHDHADNASFFRACEGNAVIFALMCNPQLRKDAFKVLRTLISASPVEDAFEDLTITIESIQSSKDNETRWHLIDGLITIVHYNFVLRERLDSAGGFRLCINTIASLHFEDLALLSQLQSSVIRLLVTAVSGSTLNRATLKSLCASDHACEMKDAMMISQPWKLLGWTPTLDGLLRLATESTKALLVQTDPPSGPTDLSSLHGCIVINAEPLSVAIQLSFDIGEQQFLLTLDAILVLCRTPANLPRLASPHVVDTLFHRAGKDICADSALGQKIRSLLRLVMVFGLSIESSKSLLACCNIGSGVAVPSCMLQLLQCVAADAHGYSTSLTSCGPDNLLDHPSTISPDQLQFHQPVAEILFPLLANPAPILVFPILGSYNPVSGSASFSVSIWFRVDAWDMQMSGQNFRVLALGFEGDSPFLEVVATPKGIHVLWFGKETEPRLLLPMQTRKWHHVVVICSKQRLGSTSLHFQVDSTSIRCEKVANLTCDARAVTWIAFGGGIGVNSTDAAGMSDLICLDASVVCGPMVHLGPAKMWMNALSLAAISTLYLAGPQHNGLFTSAFSKDMIWAEISPDVVSTSNMLHLVKCAAATAESSEPAQNFELDSVSFVYPEFDQLLLVVSALGCSDTESSPSSLTLKDQRVVHRMKCRSLVSSTDGSYSEGFCCGFLWSSVRCSLGYILRPVGGIASLLVLFESALTVDSVESLLRTMFWTVHGNATITNEFNMLGGPEIISRKLEHDSLLVTKNVMNILFAFVGFDRDSGMERGTIVNPSALVSFFLSFNIWRNASKELQIEAIAELSHGLCSNANRMYNFSVLASVDAFPRLCALLEDTSILDDTIPHILLILRVWLESKYITGYVECLRNVCFLFLPSPSTTMNLLTSTLCQNIESPRTDRDNRDFGLLSTSSRAITVVRKIIDIMTALLSSRVSKSDKLLDHFCGTFGFDFVFYCLQVDTPPVLAINAVSLLFSMLQIKQQNGLTGELQQRVLVKFRETSGFSVLNVLLLAFCNQPELYVMVLGMALGRPMGNLIAARDAINQKFSAFASDSANSSQILNTEAVVACFKLCLKEGAECKLVIPEALLIAFKLCKRACEVYYSHLGHSVAIKGSSRLTQLPRIHLDDSAAALTSFALARGTFSFFQALFLIPQHAELRHRCLKHDIIDAIVDVMLADGNVSVNSGLDSYADVIAPDRSQSPSVTSPSLRSQRSSVDIDDVSDSDVGLSSTSAEDRSRGIVTDLDSQSELGAGKEKKKMFGFLNFGRSRKGPDSAPSSAGMVDDLKRVLGNAASQSSIDSVLAVLEKFASLNIVHNKSSEGAVHDFYSQDVASACVKLLNMFVIESITRMQGSQVLAALFDSVPAFISVFESNSSTSLSVSNPLTTCFHRNLVQSHVYHIMSKPKYLDTCMQEKAIAFDTLDTISFIVDRIFCGLGESHQVLSFLVEFLTQTSSSQSSKQKEYRAKAFPILNRLLVWILTGGQPSERQMCLRNMQNNRDYIFCSDNNDPVFISIVLYTLVVHFVIGPEADLRVLALPVLKYLLSIKASVIEPLLIERSESKSLFAGSKVVLDLYKGGFDKLLVKDEDFMVWIQDSKNEAAIKTHFEDHFSRHFRSFYDDAAKRRQLHAESSQERRDTIRERILWNCRSDLNVAKLRLEEYIQKALQDAIAFRSLVASISMRYQSQRRALAIEWGGFSIQILAAGNGSKLQTPEVLQLDTCEGPGRVRRKLVAASPHMYSVLNFNKLLSGEQMQPRQVDAGLDHWTKLQQALKFTSRVNMKKKSSGADDVESDDESEDEDAALPDAEVPVSAEAKDASAPGAEKPKTEIAGLASLRSLFEGTQNDPPMPVDYLRGVNSKHALLLLGPHSFSLVVGLTLDASGLVVQTDSADVAAPLTFTYHELSRVQPQKHLFMDTAIEVFLSSGQTLFAVFKTKLARKHAIELLRARAKKHGGIDRMSISDSMHSAARFIKMGKVECRRQWLDHKMSNFDYLMALNTFAGRSFNDLTQYPVFPWVIADWESTSLDLSKPETFRDFSKPMGAQHPDKEAFFKERFEQMDENPFHYGSHYSSAGIVLNYLIRLEPYTTEAVTFQGGHLDHADRIFSSLPIAWKMASTPLSNQDVREMIPEFFYLPDFLLKPDGLDLGQLQDGTRLGDVELPPWASGSALKFIALHRQALESAYVSAHLHEWIDLVFGEKQQGPKAEESVNVFVHLTYDGKVDIDQIADPVIKASTLAQIREFGQTPRQVTKKSHEAKKPIEPRFSLLNSSPNLLCSHFRDTGSCIGDVAYSVERNVAAIGSSERVLHTSANSLILKPSSARRFFWGASDGCLRLYEGDVGQRHVAAWQSLHQGRVLVAASSHDGALVATGSADGVIMVWHADHSKELAPMRLKASLIGHYAPITALAISTIWDVVVSSSSNGSVIVWDLNSVSPINVINTLSVAASSISIGDWSAVFAVACESHLTVFDINGRLIADLDLKTNHNTGFLALVARACVRHRAPEISPQAVFLVSKCLTARKPPAAIECTLPASKTAAFISGRKFGSRSSHPATLCSSCAGVTRALQEGQKCALAMLAVHVEHQSPITSICLHPNGCKLLSADELGNINEWYRSPLPSVSFAAFLNAAAASPDNMRRYLPSSDTLALLTADGAAQQVCRTPPRPPFVLLGPTARATCQPHLLCCNLTFQQAKSKQFFSFKRKA